MSDRHPKWVRVEPGTVIPAGQPYRVEREYVAHVDVETDDGCWLVDSSWRPPLELPTEPTWGIAVTPSGILKPAQWRLTAGSQWFTPGPFVLPAQEVLDFIPLTDEQVARIEAAR